VVDFGHVLRVPLCQFEQLVGGQLTPPPVAPPSETSPEPAVAPAAASEAAPAPRNTRQRQPTKTARNPNAAQLSLIEPAIND
jgi:hypothetical protein